MLLGVNIDHVATLRNARGEFEPSVIEAAKICEINADNYKDEDTLLEEVMSQLNKMLSQKEGNLV